MKLLYISGYHSTLEYDHLSLFQEMGIDWFSTGVYLDPMSPDPSNKWRDPIKKQVDLNLESWFRQMNPQFKMHGPIYLEKEFVDNFDVVLCCFSFARQDILDNVWEACKHKPFIYLTYSQQFAPFEKKLKGYRNQGLKLIRGSERESTIGNYAGHDAIIRCYVDEDKFKGWVGSTNKILSFSHHFTWRTNNPNFNCYRAYLKYIKPNLPCDLYGEDTEVAGGRGFISTQEQLKKYQDYRLYFSLGSPPSTLTFNFLEAWMTGMPVLCFGSKVGNGVGYQTHEPPYLIDNGQDGFYSDNINELLSVANVLLREPDLAKEMGEAGRKKCILSFSKKAVKKQWSEFFKDLGYNL